jgi:hypothetical protein
MLCASAGVAAKAAPAAKPAAADTLNQDFLMTQFPFFALLAGAAWGDAAVTFYRPSLAMTLLR